MSRENLSKILSGIDQAYVDECLRESRPSEREPMKAQYKKRPSPRRLIVLVAAACLLVAMAITAYASEGFRSAIEKYWNNLIIPDSNAVRERGADEYADWLETQEEAKEKSLTIAAEAKQENTFYPITEGSEGGITLLESYYDGTDLALGCQFVSVTVPAQFDVELDDPAYADLTFRESDAQSIRNRLSEEELAELDDRLSQGGTVCVLVSIPSLRDHIYAGETDLGCIHTDPDEDGYFIVDPNMIGNEYTLPEECRDLDEITVTLNYHIGQQLYVIDGDTCRVAYLAGETYPISFTIANSADNS